MQLDSARELKATLLDEVVTPLARDPGLVGAYGLPSMRIDALPPSHRTVALGVTREGRGFRLAVRVSAAGSSTARSSSRSSRRPAGRPTLATSAG